VAAVALLAVAVGPGYRQDGGCLFCGRARSEGWRCGVKVAGRVRETEWSTWVDEIHPDHTNQIWGTNSTMRKGRGLHGRRGREESAQAGWRRFTSCELGSVKLAPVISWTKIIRS
jgi:hypothetical protein